MMSDRPEYELLRKLRPATPDKVPTNIRLIEEDEATGDLAAVYRYFREETGRQDVPGILKCFSGNPGVIRSMVDLSSSLLFADGHLTRRQKELIATYVSVLNACPYCADSHGFFALVHGVETQTLKALLGGELSNASLARADEQLLRFAQIVNDQSFKTTANDIQLLRDLGWQEAQIAETVHIVAFMGFCNRVANAFGLPSQGFLNLPQ